MYGIVIKPEWFRDYLPTSNYICIERLRGSVGSKGVPETRTPGRNYFIFIKFSAKICKMISWRTLPPLYCFCEKPHEIKQKSLPVTFVIKWFYQDLLQSSLLASNYCSNIKMLTFDKAKMLKYVITNCSS